MTPGAGGAAGVGSCRRSSCVAWGRLWFGEDGGRGAVFGRAEVTEVRIKKRVRMCRCIFASVCVLCGSGVRVGNLVLVLTLMIADEDAEDAEDVQRWSRNPRHMPN